MTRCCFLAAIAAISLGCNAMDLNQSLPWSSPKTEKDPSKYIEPETMITIWNETLYTAPGQRPTRGFGGRIFFYDKNSRPISVDGELVCYGFDDAFQDGNMTSVPDKKFVFTAEQMTHHFGESDIGASYSIFLPWDELGNPQKQISLYPVFKTSTAKVIRSAASKHVLPGQNSLTEQEQRGFVGPRHQRKDTWVTGDGVQRASHTESSALNTGETHPSGRRVSTFRMPSAMRNAPIGSMKSLSKRANRVRNVADQMILDYQKKRLEQLAPKAITPPTVSNPTPQLQQAPVQQMKQSQSSQVSQLQRRQQTRSGQGQLQRPVQGRNVGRNAVNVTIGQAIKRGAHAPNRLSQSSNGAIGQAVIPTNGRHQATASLATLRERHRRLADSQPSGHQAQTTQYGQPAYGRAPSQLSPQGQQFGLPLQR